MEVSMSKTRRGKYTDNRICYISKCKGGMRLYLRRKGKHPCFSYLVRGKSFSFYRGKIRRFPKTRITPTTEKMNDFPEISSWNILQENSSWKSACCLIPILQNHSHVIQRPFYQMIHNRNKGFSTGCERILHSWRHFGISLAGNVAISLQRF